MNRMNRFLGVFGQEMPRKTKVQYASIVLALVLVGQLNGFSSALQSTTQTALENIAGVVGMQVAVPSNEVNTLAQALEEKKTELDARERAIDAREQEIRAVIMEETAKQNRVTLYIVAFVALFLASLIVLNFYLDRSHHVPESERGVPQRTNDPHAHEGEFTTKL